MKPKHGLGPAFAVGFRAIGHNPPAIVSILVVMALMVFSYYTWPPATELLRRYGAWQASGGILFVALASGIGAGMISEFFLVYAQQQGRWFPANRENLIFKFGLCFIGGGIVAVFYRYQAYWFGDSHTWPVLVKKVFVDQFIFSVFWSTPYNTLASRWKMLGYSWRRVWAELGPDFVLERMLPMLTTNWLFWIPAITLVYSLPLSLETPLYLFAASIWGILLLAVSEQNRSVPEPEPLPALVLPDPAD